MKLLQAWVSGIDVEPAQRLHASAAEVSFEEEVFTLRIIRNGAYLFSDTIPEECIYMVTAVVFKNGCSRGLGSHEVALCI